MKSSIIEKNRDISTTEGEEKLQKFAYNANELFQSIGRSRTKDHDRKPVFVSTKEN